MAPHRLQCLLARGIALSALAATPLPARAHPVLTLTVSEHSVSITPGGQPAPPDASYPLTVTLGHRYLSYERDGKRYIDDFATARAFALDLAAHTYEENSLYADIGFRVHELENRLVLGRALAAGKVKLDMFAPANVEHEIGVEAAGENSAIDSTTQGDERVFRWKGHEFLAVSRASSPLPAEYAGEYWRFLRYFTGGHPKIYRELAHYAGVPALVRIEVTNAYQLTRTIKLAAIDVRPDEDYTLAGFTRAAPVDDPDKTIALLGADGPASVAAAVATTKAERERFLGEGRVFDAFLRHLAIVIENGDASADWLAANRARMQADPDVARLSAALKPRSAAEAEQAVKLLTALRDADPVRRYLLDVFLGNTYSKLGRDKERIERMLAALHANPYLTGAWFDLGAMYDGAFEPGYAWACWDAARRLVPDHPFGQSINAREKALRAGHPEFF